MKLTTLITLMTIFQLYASNTYSQLTKITLKVENDKISDVLKKIEDRSEYYFLYSPKLINVEKRVSINVKDEPIKTILNSIFDEDVKFEIYNRQIILTNQEIAPGSFVVQQKNTVTGTVTDEKGITLPGVSIQVESTTIGAVTDVNGKYSIDLPKEKGVLVFTFIGFTPQKVAVQSGATVNIVMVSEAQKLDEFVVIGYGTVKKADVTSSISTVGKDDLKNKSITSMEQGMQGIASGVQITQNSGEPGTGITVRVRGMSSISAGNDPLYVIDGVPFYNNPKALNLQGYQQTGWNTTETSSPNSGMSAINPNDIESIQVLKDASATAIYGNRGANGVILITTKKGRAGEGIVNFDVAIGFQNMTRPVGVLESADYVTYNHEMLDYKNSLGQTTTIARLPDNASQVNTNWQKEATLSNAVTSDYNLSFSGGNQGITYFISGNYLNQNGIVPQTGFNRRSIRSNIDAKISRNFSGGMDMTASYTKTTAGYFNQGNVGTQYYALNPNSSGMSPVNEAFNQDGSLNYINPYPEVGAPTNYFINPIRSEENSMIDILNTETFRTIGNVYLNYNIMEHLTFRSSLGIDYINVSRQQWRPKNILYPQDNDFIGRAFVSSLKFPSYIWENRLNWDKTINDHVFGVTLAQSIEWRNRFSVTSNTENFLDNTLKYNNMTAGSIVKPTQTNQSAWQLSSFIGRVNYSFKSKYIASASLRADGSSKFANNPWGFFPAFSGAWRMSEESFIKNIGFFDDLKLRVGWGATGNDEIDPYQTLLTYGIIQYPIGNVLQVGAKPNNMPYPDLTWEKTYMTSGGVDIAFFKNRILLTAEYYYKKTTDLLLYVNIPAISGFNSMLQNVGSVENKGIDLSLVTRNIEGNFNWTTKFNFSKNKNKVLELTGAKDKSGNTINYIDLAPEVSSATYRIQEGHALGEFYDYQYGGVFADAKDVASQKYQNVGPGNQKFMDLSGPNGVPDSLINSYDKTWVGDPNPKYILGIDNQFSYKSISFSFFINIVQGNTIVNDHYNTIGAGPELKEYFDKRWTPTNTNTDVPRPGGGYGNRYWDGSFVRLSNATLSYDLSPSVLSKIGISKMKVYVSGKNLLLSSKYAGYDPEVSSSGNNATMQGRDRNGYPGSKTFTLGVNLQLK